MNTFRCQVFPLFAVIDHSIPSRPKRPFDPRPSFSVCQTLADRNRGPGRVPGSPWNLSIRPTRSPPPAYRLTASSLRPSFPTSRVSTTVPSPNPLAPSILYRISSFFVPPTSSPASLLFISLFLFSLSLVCVSVSPPFLIFFVTDLTSRIFRRLFFLARPTRHRFFFRSIRKISQGS